MNIHEFPVAFNALFNENSYLSGLLQIARHLAPKSMCNINDEQGRAMHDASHKQRADQPRLVAYYSPPLVFHFFAKPARCLLGPFFDHKKQPNSQAKSKRLLL